MNNLNKITYNTQSLSHLGAELVFTQDAQGKYDSFYWQSPLIESNQQWDDHQFFPQPITPKRRDVYTEVLRRVLNRRIPEQNRFLFVYRHQTIAFELVISPILLPDGSAKRVLVMGYRLADNHLQVDSTSALPTNPDPYQKLLTNIARNIRRTLNLEIIWQKTGECYNNYVPS